MISVTNSDKGSFTMKFSTRDRYALRLMAELARYAPGTTVSLKKNTKRQNHSQKN